MRTFENMSNPATSTISSTSPSLNSSKSKKSKSDVIRSACGVHLKQKSFVASDKFRKSDFQLQQTKKQFAIQKMVESDLTNENTFSYSNVLCISNNLHIADQQFFKFTQFVEDQDDGIRLELRRFYGPLLCHLYMVLLKSKEGRFAFDFLRKYANLIAPVHLYDLNTPKKYENLDEEGLVVHKHFGITFVKEELDAEDSDQEYFVRLISALSTCNRSENIDNDPVISQFRNSKYEIHTSELVYRELNNYLTKSGHVILMNLIQSWINVHIIENEIEEWNEEDMFLDQDDNIKEEVIDQKIKLEIPYTDEPIEAIKVEVEDIKVEDKAYFVKDVYDDCTVSMLQAKDQILKCQTILPCFLKLNTLKGMSPLTTADMDSNECHLVAGFANSSVRLWQLSELTQSGINRYKPFYDRTCGWDMNNLSTVEVEEELEDDEQKKMKAKTKSYFEKKSLENSLNSFGGVAFRGHSLGVTSVKFSKMHPILLSTSYDATIRVWKSCDYKTSSIYRGHRYPVWCLDESPMGSYIATGSKDLTARLWCVDRTFPLVTFIGHVQDVQSVAFHPNGNYLATGSDDCSVRLWCVSSGKLMRVFNDSKQTVSCLAFSPDGKLLAAGGEESKIRIYDLAAGCQLNDLKELSAPLRDLAWSPNSKLIGSVSRDNALRLWDARKLIPLNDISSSGSSSSSSTINRFMTVYNKCDNFVKVVFPKEQDCVYCIGA